MDKSSMPVNNHGHGSKYNYVMEKYMYVRYHWSVAFVAIKFQHETLTLKRHGFPYLLIEVKS